VDAPQRPFHDVVADLHGADRAARDDDALSDGGVRPRLPSEQQVVAGHHRHAGVDHQHADLRGADLEPAALDPHPVRPGRGAPADRQAGLRAHFAPRAGERAVVHEHVGGARDAQRTAEVLAAGGALDPQPRDLHLAAVLDPQCDLALRCPHDRGRAGAGDDEPAPPADQQRLREVVAPGRQAELAAGRR
jgi:hypothetical protein